jgi:hypothetical protein
MTAAVFLLACAVLAYTGFCRLVHTDLSTALAVRLVFWALTVAAFLAAAAVLFWAYRPGWPAAGLAVAMASVQVVTSRIWRSGVPQPYRRSNQ